MGSVVRGALVVGVPRGSGLAMVVVRMMPLFFILTPPLVAVPVGHVLTLVVSVARASAVLCGAALAAVRS